ncbi:N-acetylmuramoyl-L-alanine amidase [Aestuariibius sp. HNIBRBA575]|uniref:N-acetylmuramoyl-L-alanine amidase n=1 Tax=Aestuariibius sp. HNIBRBA575 TaxID=3233343 RepID=UPI0034A3ED3C
MTPIWHPSPNFGPRRDLARPSLVLIHYTAMDSAEAALERLCDPGPEVSAHYLIGEKGTLWQMVREDDRAWHAGAGSWMGCDDINSQSIGIELANRGDHPFSEPQMTVLEKLLAGILTRWSISPQSVLGHSDTAPGRKIDPGKRFDWKRLADAGLAHWPEPVNGPEMDGDGFVAAMRNAGYTGSADAAVLLDVLRHRYRPFAQGPRGAADEAVARGL